MNSNTEEIERARELLRASQAAGTGDTAPLCPLDTSAFALLTYSRKSFYMYACTSQQRVHVQLAPGAVVQSTLLLHVRLG